MCKTRGESIDHLFLHCMVAIKLRSTILQLFGAVWIMPRSVKEMGELEGPKGQPVVGADLENGSIVCDVESIE
jgi:hypothetical protein